ncbi:MAG: DNA-binding protein [Clostridia bacterium]|nr:DNA-binding protein [Clostridia bacterium]
MSVSTDKSVNMALLLDFYGVMLSEKQRDTMELYYNEDMSLSEIAEIHGISRAGVRDRIMKSEAMLTGFEEKLGLIKRFEDMKAEIADIREILISSQKTGDIPVDEIISRLEKLN